MKLRLNRNSVRLRLSQGEVAKLVDQGLLEEGVEFAQNSRFVYTLEAADNIERTRALYDNGSIRIQVPRCEAVDWARTDRVGIVGEQASLTILIEKDFKCLHGDVPDPDAFPNPLEDLTN